MGFTGAVAIFVAVSLEVLAQLSFKRGTLAVCEQSASQSTSEYLFRIIGDTWVRIGIIAYLFEILFAVAALNLAPLSVVFPLLSLSYCGVAIVGSLVLGEQMEPRTRAGIVLITLGAAMVSWSSAR